MTTNKLVHKQDETHIRRGKRRRVTQRHVVISAVPKATEIQQQYERNFNIALNRWLSESILQGYEDADEGKQDIRYKLLVKGNGEDTEGDQP